MRGYFLPDVLGASRVAVRKIKRAFYQPLLYSVAKNLCYWVFKIAWRLNVQGVENVPLEGAVIIASNHRSLADPPLVGSSLPRHLHFLAKEELFSFKPFGWLIRNLNAHPLRRASSDVRAFKAAREILGSGEGLILFPEGRRGKTDDLQAGKAGVGMLAAMSDCPVVPVYIENSGHMKSFKPITVAFGRPIRFTGFLSYQAMADGVMAEIARLKAGLAGRKI